MSETLEIKKLKIDSLVDGFTNSGYKTNNRIGQPELLEFLSNRTSSGQFDPILAEKLFLSLNLDNISTMFVEDFINGYLKFEEDLKRNSELFAMKFSQEQEIYNNLEAQCQRYKDENLNSEGLCENSKVYGEIIDIDLKRKLEGIKEIIIKVIYNEKSEELHFKIGDLKSQEMLNKTFGFKPTSRKDHFEFIMKGINDRNQVFDIGSKVFPFTDVNSQEEYLVKIEVPEIDNEEVIAAYIHAKIVLYWSDYNYYDKQRRKAESKLKKLNSAMNKLADYLKKLREIYGDLTKKKPDLIVNFNNEKLLQRKGDRYNVNFNNEKEVSTPGGNYMVEFNNQREKKRNIGPLRVEFNNTKEIIKESKIKNTNISNSNININTEGEAQTFSNFKKPIIREEYENKNITEYTNEQQIINSSKSPKQEQNIELQQNNNQNTINMNNEAVEEVNVNGNGTTTPINQINNYEINQSNLPNTFIQEQNIGSNLESAQNEGNFESMGYKLSGAMGNTEDYLKGFESTDNNNNIINQSNIHTSLNGAMLQEITNKPLFTENTLPVQVLPEKVNKVIVYNNVSSLPIIFGGKSVTYVNEEETNKYFNNYFQDNQNL